jgi:hypothetical protein
VYFAYRDKKLSVSLCVFSCAASDMVGRDTARSECGGSGICEHGRQKRRLKGVQRQRRCM